MIEWILIIL